MGEQGNLTLKQVSITKVKRNQSPEMGHAIKVKFTAG
jgi:hypothetical protein